MKKILAILLVLFVASQLVFAGLVTAKELAAMTKEGEVVIISARPPADYSSKHITGAVNIDHKTLYKTEGVSSMLKDPAEIAAILGEKGINENSKIVIYDGGSNKTAGRLYWILKYMGAKDVNILDGHIKAWMKARKPVTSKATEITPVTFTPTVDQSIYASMDYIKANLENPDILLVDVRSMEEFEGRNEDDNLTRKGHIPGAVQFEYSQVFDADGVMKSKEEIGALLTEAGISADKEIVIYCATSVRAGIVFAALKDIMEFPNVKVFDGAFYEWDSKAINPIE
ncbi:sulfurtransferase [Candidatus Cloacimonadota bacterium]